MKTKYRLGFCGFGVISAYYLKALRNNQQFELTAVCDISPGKLEPFRGTGVELFGDYRELTDWDGIDAVVINLPNDLHAPACHAALAAGKHVCCEKPLTTRVADAADLVRLARERKRALFTAFHRRYNDNVLAALAAVRGRPIASVTANYLELIEDHCGTDRWYLDPTRAGGGCIADNGPNVFDALAGFLGPLTVTDCAIEETRDGVDLRARVRLRGADGTPAEVFLDWAYPGERKDVVIQLIDGQTVTADMLAGFTGFKSSLDHEYERILADFASQIRAGNCFGVNGLEVARLVEAAYAFAAAATASPSARS